MTEIVSSTFVAVHMITYNHEPYIEQAILSVLNQETTFDYKIYIRDDNSTDATAVICRRLEKAYPEKIEFNSNRKNLGAIENCVRTFETCLESNAQFIAICEGDDYWTDPLKLQKQVDLLETNAQMSMVFSNAQKLVNDKFVPFYELQLPPLETGLSQFIHGHHGVTTATVLMRESVIDEVLNQLSKTNTQFFHMDYFMWCMAAKQGTIGFLPENMAVYRVHANSMIRTAETRPTLENGMKMNAFLARYLGPEYKEHFLKNNWWYYLEFAYTEIHKKNLLTSFYWLFRSLIESVKFRKGNQLQIIRDYGYRLRNRKAIYST